MTRCAPVRAQTSRSTFVQSSKCVSGADSVISRYMSWSWEKMGSSGRTSQCSSSSLGCKLKKIGTPPQRGTAISRIIRPSLPVECSAEARSNSTVGEKPGTTHRTSVSKAKSSPLSKCTIGWNTVVRSSGLTNPSKKWARSSPLPALGASESRFDRGGNVGESVKKRSPEIHQGEHGNVARAKFHGVVGDDANDRIATNAPPAEEVQIGVEGDSYADTDPSAMTDYRSTLDPYGR